jgi:UDP-N-acetylmuramoyl-L-alanyl-D-glutamate--2,6-diaminopimelate ligase
MPSLSSLLTDLPVRVLGDAEVEVRGIAYDSRRVQPGDLFACIPVGERHGHAYLPQALAAGAAAVLVEDAALAPAGVPTLVAEDALEATALLAANFYGRPAEALTLIGVTGTNGKTTTTTLLRTLLQVAGYPTGLIGTMAYHIGDTVIPAANTTPLSPDLQALLARMRDAGLTHVVMEVSSHGLALHRVTGCRFQAAAFTNLTQDHLDFHKTLDAYRDAKITLFADPRYQPRDGAMISVLNADDPAAPAFAARALGPVRTFGLGGGDYRAEDVTLAADGSTFTLAHPGGRTPVRLQLVGSFNVSNALAALALALELGVAPALAAEVLATIPPVDGRFQRVPSPSGLPSVIVDYAHTPDGLEKVLATADEIAPGRVIALFGCGGDRDAGKRPKMAAIAARYAREVIVTSDNPRTEDPARIIAGIVAGFTDGDLAKVTVEPDRAAAIRLAIDRAGADDLVVLAGKGHEDYQILATGKIHFDDREEAARALAARAGAGDRDAPCG